jgi:hypothetical protein
MQGKKHYNASRGGSGCLSFRFFAMNSLRFFMFVCVFASCLTVGCRERPSQSGKESVNIFNRKVGKPTERSSRPVNPVVLEGFRQTGDPAARDYSTAAVKYGLFVVGLAVVVGGIVGWQVWRRKKAEWELNDPMALVQELNAVHQLSEREKRFMQDLSTQHALSSPLNLFVEPKFLLQTLEDSWATTSQPTVRQLLSKLFDITVEGNQGSTVIEGSGIEGSGIERSGIKVPGTETAGYSSQGTQA